MKTIIDYINENIMNIFEATFSTNEWFKHGKQYSNAVIDTICGKHDTIHKLAIGSKSAEQLIDPVDISDEDKKLVQQLKTVDDDPVNKFNSIMKKYGCRWTKIWKGPYSGYNSEISKNKGNAFEQEFISNFETKYKPELETELKQEINVYNISPDGATNTARPLTVINDKLYVFPQNHTKNDGFNIGKAVTDVTINVDNCKPIYLSLKYGNKVTFVNAGVNNSDCFSTKTFKDGNFGKKGEAILKMFSINKQKFIDIFNSYSEDKSKRRANKDVEDITNKLNNDFFEFVKSVIGYGFVLVHQDNKGKTHYYSLLSEKDMNNFIGNNIIKAYIEYPKNGTAKRIDIFVELEKLILNFNIRSKNGGIYPTHIMADYTIK